MIICGNWGLKHIPLSVYSIILNLKPILVILLGFCYNIEKITKKKVILILISFIGASLIVDPAFFSGVYNQIFNNSVQPELEQKYVEKGKKPVIINRRTHLLFFMFGDLFLCISQSLHIYCHQKRMCGYLPF